jgi:branched-chain amino acid transport system substrate-binding protein
MIGLVALGKEQYPMFGDMKDSHSLIALTRVLAALLCVALIAAGCGSDSSDDTLAAATVETTDAVSPTSMEHLGDGSFGVVQVAPGDAIQIRSLNAISEEVADFGLPLQRGAELGVADYGTVRGFEVDLGSRFDGQCTNFGGVSAGQAIARDESVIGVIGTSCSGAAAGAAPLITGAGMAMISPGNTSPALTSDLAGNPGENYHVGYYRTAHNDLFQGRVMAEFVHDELGLGTAAAIHDGDPYTRGLAEAFADAFEALGGTITGFTAVNKDDTNMVPVLLELAAGSPEALFFPVFQPVGGHIAEQVPTVQGMEEVQMFSADGLLTAEYLSLPQSVGMYFSGPDTRYGGNVNQSTGKTAEEFLDAYEAAYEELPTSSFWAHAYDATTLLLDAITAASYVTDEGVLMIDRAGVREFLDSVDGYRGLIGEITCDEFGDCGSQKITVVHHTSTDVDATMNNVVYAGGGN